MTGLNALEFCWLDGSRCALGLLLYCVQRVYLPNLGLPPGPPETANGHVDFGNYIQFLTLNQRAVGTDTCVASLGVGGKP